MRNTIQAYLYFYIYFIIILSNNKKFVKQNVTFESFKPRG